jgi:hypothetical protein
MQCSPEPIDEFPASIAGVMRRNVGRSCSSADSAAKGDPK